MPAVKKLSEHNIRAFQEDILTWYSEHQRDLPWRSTRDAYKILVSEMMLQQTQVARVIPKYEAWLKKFPNVESLAQARTTDVLQFWSGLGYNRRALYLQKAAQTIVSAYDGLWPQEPEALEKLPGIGKYTSRAVACFVFDKQVAVVDTNIRKVILLHFFPKADHKYVSAKTIDEYATRLLPLGRAYEWNQALMDYAAAILKKEKIPVAKQSKFIGSNRYYRGKLLRLLLEKGNIKKTELRTVLKPDADDAWLRTLLTQMEKDGFIHVTEETVSLR